MNERSAPFGTVMLGVGMLLIGLALYQAALGRWAYAIRMDEHQQHAVELARMQARVDSLMQLETICLDGRPVWQAPKRER